MAACRGSETRKKASALTLKQQRERRATQSRGGSLTQLAVHPRGFRAPCHIPPAIVPVAACLPEDRYPVEPALHVSSDVLLDLSAVIDASHAGYGSRLL